MKIQVKQMYPQMMMGNGIMTDLSDFSVPWHNADYVAQLDLGYYSHSAQKLISPVVFDISGNIENIMSCSDISELTEAQRTAIAGMIFNIYNRKWQKLWSVYEIEYNPIENYSMTETETIDRDVSRSGTDGGTVNTANTGTIGDSGTEGGTLTTVTDGETTNTGTQSNAGTSNTQDGIFGFNSSSAVGSDTSDNQNSNLRTDNLASTEDETVTETRNLTNANTRTLNTTDLETRNLTHNDTEADDSTRELTRSGNIGVTTSQRMIQSELELWQWNFFKQVFEDIDSILCLDIY